MEKPVLITVIAAGVAIVLAVGVMFLMRSSSASASGGVPLAPAASAPMDAGGQGANAATTIPQPGFETTTPGAPPQSAIVKMK